MISLEKKHYDVLKSILNQAGVKFYVFGSRTKTKHKKFSDIDLCYMESIPRKVLTKIKMELSDSNIPYKIDIVDWNQCDQEFQDLIKDDLIEIV